MKRFLFFFGLLLIQTCDVSAQAFWKSYLINDGLIGNTVSAFDGGFITVCTKYIAQPGPWVSCIIKTDNSGDTSATLILDSATTVNTNSADVIIRTVDSCYVVGGRCQNYVYLMKLDGYGNILWKKVINPYLPSSVYSVDIKQTFDKGFIFVFQRGGGGGKVILKTDSIGNPLDRKILDMPIQVIEHPTSIQQTMDSGYVILSLVYFINGTTYKSMITRLDKDLNLKWNKISDTNPGNVICIYETSDSCLVFSSLNKLIKLTSNADTVWTRAYACDTSNLIFYDLKKCSNGDFISICKKTTSLGSCVYFRTDSLGIIKWGKGFDGETAQFYKIDQIAGDSIVISGVESLMSGDYIHLVKTDSTGNNICGTDSIIVRSQLENQATFSDFYLVVDSAPFLPPPPSLVSINFPISHGVTEFTNCISTGNYSVEDKGEYSIYPNPSTGKFHLKNIEHNSEIKILNLLGKIIYQSSNINSDSEIDLTNQPKGVYFCNIISKNNFRETVKIILQ